MKRVLVGPDGAPDTPQVMQAAVDLSTLMGARVVSAAGLGWRDVCAQAEEEGVALVVVGAHRSGPLDRIRGTVAARVVNHCRRSVLAVRSWRRTPRRLLVALDRSEGAALVRDFAVAFARQATGKVRLFHAVDMPPVIPGDLLEQFPTMEIKLRDAASKILGGHERLVPQDLRDGIGADHGAAVWPEICAAAREYDADVVVMGSHRRKLEDRLVGTTAGQVVDHADRSVLVVRQPWPSG